MSTGLMPDSESDLENAQPERAGGLTRWLRGVRDGSIPGGPL